MACRASLRCGCLSRFASHRPSHSIPGVPRLHSQQRHQGGAWIPAHYGWLAHLLQSHRPTPLLLHLPCARGRLPTGAPGGLSPSSWLQLRWTCRAKRLWRPTHHHHVRIFLFLPPRSPTMLLAAASRLDLFFAPSFQREPRFTAQQDQPTAEDTRSLALHRQGRSGNSRQPVAELPIEDQGVAQGGAPSSMEPRVTGRPEE